MKYASRSKVVWAATVLTGTALSTYMWGAKPAEAKWTLYTDGSGTNTTTCTGCGPNNTDINNSGSWGEPRAQIDQLPPNKEGSAKTDGTITLKLKWTADFPGQEMPKTVKVLISADAAAGEHHPAYQGEDYASAEIEVSNSLGGEYKNEDSFNWMNVYKAASKRAKVLRELNVSSDGIAKIDIKMSASVKATAKWYVSSMLSAGASATMAEDTRSVVLTRIGAPTPKLWDDPTLDKTKDEWVDKDGTRYGHTRWSYKDRVDSVIASGDIVMNSCEYPKLLVLSLKVIGQTI
jgi:hypothetical protein